MRAFVDFKSLGVKERFPANVADAIRVMLVKVGGQSAEDVELLVTQMARVRTRIDFIICDAFGVDNFLVGVRKMASHLVDICQVEVTDAAF